MRFVWCDRPDPNGSLACDVLPAQVSPQPSYPNQQDAVDALAENSDLDQTVRISGDEEFSSETRYLYLQSPG